MKENILYFVSDACILIKLMGATASRLMTQQENIQNNFMIQLRSLSKAFLYTNNQGTFLQTEKRGRGPKVNMLIQLYTK